MDRLDRCIQRLKEPTTLDQLRDCFAEELQKLGFGYFTYLSVHLTEDTKPLPYVITNYPQEWVERYVGEGYVDFDPVLRKGMHAIVPFTWGTQEERDDLQGKTKKLFEESESFGIKCGISVPIFGKSGEFALLSMATNLPDTQFKKLISEVRYHTHILSLYFHEAVGILISSANPRDGVLNLTSREIECLFWTSLGKTSWEIAKILNVSEHTFNFHMRNATRKLGTYSKHHAVVRAMTLGLLKPE